MRRVALLALAAACSQPPAAPPPGPVLFTDQAAALGVRFQRTTGASGRRLYPEQHGGGLALADLDGDGWLDLVAIDGGVLPGYTGPVPAGHRVFRNRGGAGFADVTSAWGLEAPGYGLGLTVGDIDADGRPDLVVLEHGAVRVWRNDASGLLDVTARTGIDGGGWNAGAVLADLTGDGRPDLYLARYVRWDAETNPACHMNGQRFACTPYMFAAQGDRLLRGDPGLRFTDISRAAGLITEGRGLGVIAGDLTGDGRPDLYVANDEDPNLLYVADPRPQRAPALREEGLTRGLSVSAAGLVQAGMGVDIGDVHNDGLPDVVVTNFEREPVALYRNLGEAGFSDVAGPAGLARATRAGVGFGVLLEDFDNDGWRDLFVANGHVWDNADKVRPGSTHGQRNQLFRNRGDGRFEPWPDPGPAFARAGVSRGAIAGDWDRDGDLDIAWMDLDGPLVMARNDGGHQRAWVRIRLEGAPPNTEAIGARVRVTTGDLTQIREVRRGRSWASAGPAPVHFGLGSAARVDRIEVRWPDGSRAESRRLAPRLEYSWRQGRPSPSVVKRP